jgi:hypothetical protein
MVPYALAFYAGLRRAEIKLNGIPDVLEAAEEAKLSPLGLHLLMVSPAAEEGTPLAEWLPPDDVSQQRVTAVILPALNALAELAN